MMRTISDHIHAAHLDAFKCPTCGVRKNTRRLFFSHVRRFHRGIFPCDICGRPLTNSEGLAGHKWLHMNETEQEEARLSGRKDPRSYRQLIREKEAQLVFSCSICQKQFRSQVNLRKHERAHSEGKERVICPVCGKSILKQTYDSYHRKYSCPLDGTGVEQFVPVKCLHCPSMLRTLKGFRIHMARSHPPPGKERPHLCSVCGMRSKTRAELRKHMEIHDEERRYKCRRGCGMDFNVNRNWRRHEAKCEFSAGDDVMAVGEVADGSILCENTFVH